MFDYHKYEAFRPEFHPVRHRKKDLYSVDVKITSGYKEMDEDTRKIAMRARESMEWFTIADAMGWTRGLTEQSIRARLSSLVDKGVLEKEGRTRSTRFRFSDPFRSLKETVRLMND